MMPEAFIQFSAIYVVIKYSLPFDQLEVQTTDNLPKNERQLTILSFNHNRKRYIPPFSNSNATRTKHHAHVRNPTKVPATSSNPPIEILNLANRVLKPRLIKSQINNTSIKRKLTSTTRKSLSFNPRQKHATIKKYDRLVGSHTINTNN